MTPAVKTPLPAIDENLFCQLLEGPGKVRVDIVRFEQYFAPFVRFFADSEAAPVPYGVLLHGRRDLLAARTVPELIVLLRDIAGDADSLVIYLPSSPAVWRWRLDSSCASDSQERKQP